jgi:membrane fusion protein (multidrug efflux system)
LLAINDEDLMAQKARLQAQMELAQRTRSRNAELLAVQGISRQEADQAETQVKILEAELRSVEAALNKTRLRAPFSGILGFCDLQKGGYISTGMALARLQDVATLKLGFSVPGKYAAEIRPGTRVRFSVESETDTFEATVFAIDPVIDAASRSLRVRARFPNNRGLRAGSFARTQVSFNPNKNSLAVPTQSVIPDTRGKKVVRIRKGQPEFSFIETGIRNRDYIQVLKGLEPGDTILTTGLMFVRPGTPVRITKTVHLHP